MPSAPNAIFRARTQNPKYVSILLFSKTLLHTAIYRFRHVRGKGFMQGLVCTLPVGQVATKALEKGLIVISAGSDVIRFVPPLIIEKEHVDEMIAKLKQVLED